MQVLALVIDSSFKCHAGACTCPHLIGAYVIKTLLKGEINNILLTQFSSDGIKMPPHISSNIRLFPHDLLFQK